MKYSDIHEYSWAALTPGGVGFTKTPAGRFYHDYYGENLFRSDMVIERTPVHRPYRHVWRKREKRRPRIRC